MSARALLIEGASPPTAGEFDSVFLLNNWADGDPKAESLPDLVDREADQLQIRIVQWLLELRNALPNGHRASLHPIFEGNYATTPEFYLLAQLLVLCQRLKALNVVELHYSGSHLGIQTCLDDWCTQNRIQFSKEKSRRRRGENLRHLVSRWRKLCQLGCLMLGNSARGLPRKAELEHIFVDYLVGDPLTTYWGPLASEISNLHGKSTFVHVYTQHDQIRSIWQARRHLRRLQRQPRSIKEILVEDLLRPVDLPRILRDSKLLDPVLTTNSRVHVDHWMIDGIRADLLFATVLKRGSRSASAVDAIAKCIGFTRLLEAADDNRTLVYLMENHVWEKALLCAKKSHTGKTIGVAHTVVRPLDLRYRILARDIDNASSGVRLCPDRIATNGAATQRMLEHWTESDRLFPTEALRYLHLKQSEKPTSVQPLRVLLAGDLLPTHTERVFRVVNDVLTNLKADVTFKPHPAETGDVRIQTSFEFARSNRPLTDLLSATDVMIAGSITAATAEAIQSNVPVITVVDPCYFNLSPLRGVPSQVFVRDSSDLEQHLKDVREMNPSRAQPFTIDRSLKRWRALLLD